MYWSQLGGFMVFIPPFSGCVDKSSVFPFHLPVDIWQIDISPAKWIYLGTTRNANWDMWPNGELQVSPERQRRGSPFYVLGRGCCKLRIHWRKLKVWNVVASHWLSYGKLPVAELLLGREESFLYWAEKVSQPSDWGSEVASLLVRDAKYASSS